MYIFKQVLFSERLQKEHPKLIGEYVVVGRSKDDMLLAIILGGRKEYALYPSELSTEQYKDAFGTIKY